MASFAVPQVSDNQDAWGPTADPSDFAYIYAPFSKSEKLGKSADWTGNQGNYRGRFQQHASAVNPAFHISRDEDDSDFSLVDSRQVQKPKQYGRRQFQYQSRWRQQKAARERAAAQAPSGGKKVTKALTRNQRWQAYRRWNYDKYNQRQSTGPSVDVKQDWEVVEQLHMSQLQKISAPVPSAEDLTSAGSLKYYETFFDRLTTRSARRLAPFSGAVYRVSTQDDPILQDFASSNTGNVFATDQILAVLMTAPRSFYSWDLIVTKKDGKIYFDKRDAGRIDYLTVGETSHDPPTDDAELAINTPAQLSAEATRINTNFAQQVLTGESDGPYDMERPHPFAGGASGNAGVASVGYRYRRWTLGDDIVVVARTEVDGAMPSKTDASKVEYVTVRALNEYEPKVGMEWARVLDTKPGGVLASELKNNSNKLGQWTTQALLSGSDRLRLGYVARVHPRDNSKHQILGVQRFKPHEFARQINLYEGNIWAILTHLIKVVRKMDDGRYLLMKDPQKPILRFYAIGPLDFQDDMNSREQGDDDGADDGADQDAGGQQQQQQQQQQQRSIGATKRRVLTPMSK